MSFESLDTFAPFQSLRVRHHAEGPADLWTPQLILASGGDAVVLDQRLDILPTASAGAVCQWNGPSAGGRTHRWRLKSYGVAGNFRVGGKTTPATVIVATFAVVDLGEYDLNIVIPSAGGEVGWTVLAVGAPTATGFFRVWALQDVT